MHRCYAPVEAWNEDGTITLSKEESHHACKVLRAGTGEWISVFDGTGRSAQAKVEIADPECAILRIQSSNRAQIKGGIQCALIQVLPKGSRMDSIIEKCTELGIPEIYPVTSEHCLISLSPDRKESRLARWNRIALSAAKQCKTPSLPFIAPVCPLTEITISQFDVCLVATLLPGLAHIRTQLRELPREAPLRLAIVIGPEGDLSPAEVETLKHKGAIPVSLGPNTLRVETAAIYAAAAVSYEFAI